MQWIGYLTLRLVVLIFWFIPFPVLHFISDGFAFLLHKVIKYRKKVINENLKRCFPNKTKEEIEALTFKFYQNLSDIILETIKSFTMSVAQLQKRFTILNPETLNDWTDKGQSVLICGSHFNNWEWGAQLLKSFLNTEV